MSTKLARQGKAERCLAHTRGAKEDEDSGATHRWGRAYGGELVPLEAI